MLFITIVHVMRRCGPYRYSRATFRGEKSPLHSSESSPEPPPSNINAATWKGNDCDIEPLRLLVDEHLLAEVGYCSLGYSNYPAQRARHA